MRYSLVAVMAVLLLALAACGRYGEANYKEEYEVYGANEPVEDEASSAGILLIEPGATSIGFKVNIVSNFDITGAMFNPRYDIYSILGDEHTFVTSVPGILTKPFSGNWDSRFGDDVLVVINSCSSHISPYYGFGHGIYKTDKYEFIIKQYVRGPLDISMWEIFQFDISVSSKLEVLETQVVYQVCTDHPIPPFSLESVDLFMLENFTSVFFTSRAAVEHDKKIAAIFEMYENGKIDELPKGMGSDGIIASGYTVVYSGGEFFVILGFWPWGYREASFRYVDGEFVKMDVFVFSDGPWGGVCGINWFPTEYAQRRIDEHRDVILWNGL